ncbi:MAG: hypothetical protein C4530_00400, partial [Desulfobacteraceae bacterium]
SVKETIRARLCVEAAAGRLRLAAAFVFACYMKLRVFSVQGFSVQERKISRSFFFDQMAKAARTCVGFRLHSTQPKNLYI